MSPKTAVTGRSMSSARAGREAAVTAVEAAVELDWWIAASRCVVFVAHRQLYFITDDVWDALARSYPTIHPHEPRAMGAVMRRAVKDGTCVLKGCEHCKTTKVTTTGRRAHGNATDMPVYRSLLHKPR